MVLLLNVFPFFAYAQGQ